MSTPSGWQLADRAPETYERYLVPGIFGTWAHLLTELADLQPGQRVLDVACGTGIVARLAAQKVGATGQVIGLDMNPGMLEVARSLPPNEGAPVEWRGGEALSIRPRTAGDLLKHLRTSTLLQRLELDRQILIRC